MKVRNVDSVAREIPGVGLVQAGAEIEIHDDLGQGLLLQPCFEAAGGPDPYEPPRAARKAPRNTAVKQDEEVGGDGA